jgi:hypothetical protein
MDRIIQWIFLFEWKNEFVLLLIPIVLISGIGIFVLRQFDRSTKKLQGNFTFYRKKDTFNKIIIENDSHEKLLNALKDIINCTIRSRSLLSRINVEMHNIDQLVNSQKNIKEQDIFVVSQLYNSIINHSQELEKNISKLKELLPEKPSTILLKEQGIILQTEQILKEFIKLYQDKLYLDYYPKLVGQIDFYYNEIVGLYQSLTDIFQQELIEGPNN